MKIIINITLFMLGLPAIPAVASASILILYTFDDANGFTPEAEYSDPQIEFASAWESSGILRNFAGESGQAIAHNGDNVFSFNLEVSPGYGLNLDSLGFWARRSSAGSTDWIFSVNGTPTATGIDMSEASEGVQFSNVLLEPEITEPLSGEVLFTLETLGAVSGTGTFRVDNFKLYGSVSPIPEPGAFALLAGLITFAFVVRRRQ